MRIVLITALAIGALVSAAPACAEVRHFTASLNGASETPPNDSGGTGVAKVDLDTDAKTVSWIVTYGGLSGPATAAHFHGPAQPGRAAGVEVPLKGDLSSPITGSAAVSDAQIADLRAGQWYVNVHTAAHPAGEIRGQVAPAN
jgi:hypothetical protein